MIFCVVPVDTLVSTFRYFGDSNRPTSNSEMLVEEALMMKDHLWLPNLNYKGSQGSIPSQDS